MLTIRAMTEARLILAKVLASPIRAKAMASMENIARAYGKGGKSYGSSPWSGGKSSKGFGGKDAGKGFGKQS